MDDAQIELVKHRDIHFFELHPDPNQAQTAALLLSDVKGILRAMPITPIHLQISYKLLDVTLEQIESGLVDIGLHLDGSLYHRLKRSLCYYAEDTQRSNLGCLRSDSKCMRKIFADRYQRLDHGCRDQRPEHWRKYL